MPSRHYTTPLKTRPGPTGRSSWSSCCWRRVRTPMHVRVTARHRQAWCASTAGRVRSGRQRRMTTCATCWRTRRTSSDGRERGAGHVEMAETERVAGSTPAGVVCLNCGARSEWKAKADDDVCDVLADAEDQ